MALLLVGWFLYWAEQPADDAWQQWRGPLRDGAMAHQLPDSLPPKLKQVWQVQVGHGYGSPIGWQQKVYLPVRKKDKEWILCIDSKTGNLLWEKAFAADFKENSYATKYGKGPFATPLIRQGKLVVVTVTGQVHCLDGTTGAEIWQATFDAALTDDRLLFCGNTASPLAVDENVVVHVGDETHGRMSAHHLKTGASKWSWTGDIAGYASPALMTFAGKRQIVSATQNKLVGIDPQSGRTLWEHPWQVQWRENIVMPIQHGDGIIVSGREQKAIVKFNIENKGKTWRLTEAWRNEDLAMYMSSPVLVNNRLFGFSHRKKGHFFCLDAKTGALIWEGPGRGGMNAALIQLKDRILALSTDGKLVIFSAEGEAFQPLETYKVSESETWAHPLILDDLIIIKDRETLTGWRF